jgi:hypothetical protein
VSRPWHEALASSSHRSRRYARPGPPQSAAATPVPHQVTDITASSASVNIRTALPPQPKSPKTRLPTDCQIERLITLGPNHHLRAFLVGEGGFCGTTGDSDATLVRGSTSEPFTLVLISLIRHLYTTVLVRLWPRRPAHCSSCALHTCHKAITSVYGGRAVS